MKRIALLGLTAIGTAGLLVSPLTAAEGGADKPAPSQAAETPAKKEGHKGKKWQHRGPGGFKHDRRPGGFGFGHHGPRGFHPGGPAGLSHLLNLTDEQKAKVKEIMDANRPKIEAIRKEEQAKIKAVLDESMKQIETILTPDQKQVLADMEKLRQSREKLKKDAKTQ
jgi:LTXXQ motif.